MSKFLGDFNETPAENYGNYPIENGEEKNPDPLVWIGVKTVLRNSSPFKINKTTAHSGRSYSIIGRTPPLTIADGLVKDGGIFQAPHHK
jgi:hypothetical protein